MEGGNPVNKNQKDGRQEGSDEAPAGRDWQHKIQPRCAPRSEDQHAPQESGDGHRGLLQHPRGWSDRDQDEVVGSLGVNVGSRRGEGASGVIGFY